MSPINDSPSGSDKGQICSIIAKVIFTNHPKYGHACQENQKKFRDAVNNRINNLRTKYKKLKARFSDTGASVMPLDGMATNNLLGVSFYTELNGIWHLNPSMAAKTHLSKPGVDHAGAFRSLVQLRGGAGPPPSFGTSPSPSTTSSTNAHDAPPPTIYPPSAGAYGTPPPTLGPPSAGAYDMPLLTLGPPSAGAYDMPLLTLGPPSAGAHYMPPPTVQRSISPYGNPLIDPQLLQAQTPAPTPPFTSPQMHLPGLRNSPDVTMQNDFTPESRSDPLNAPLGNVLDFIDNDNDK
ncbi:hypothetical protein BDR07DRAFT_1497713 [Suillus spraguei]|nr:hypothetical protein BDR07DRAFT_1497713 [Suillus spraguei]